MFNFYIANKTHPQVIVNIYFHNDMFIMLHSVCRCSLQWLNTNLSVQNNIFLYEAKKVFHLFICVFFFFLFHLDTCVRYTYMYIYFQQRPSHIWAQGPIFGGPQILFLHKLLCTYSTVKICLLSLSYNQWSFFMLI